MNYSFTKARFIAGIIALSMCHVSAEACPRIAISRSVKAQGATLSTLKVSISDDGIFRARVYLPDQVGNSSCTTRLYSRLKRENDTIGDIKRLDTKIKVGKVVQFRAAEMPGVIRSGDDAPSLTFIATTQCENGFGNNSDSVARFLDCGSAKLDRVEPAEFVRLLRKKIR